MTTIAQRLTRYKPWWRVALLGAVLWLLPAVAAEAAGCWCDPRQPGNLSQCWDDWTVTERATGFFNVVCEGAPPGTGGFIGGFVAPHACPQLSLAISGQPGIYEAGGNVPPVVSTFSVQPFFAVHCIPLEVAPPFIVPRWKELVEAKQANSTTIGSNVRQIVIFQQRLAATPVFSPQWQSLKRVISLIAGATASVVQAINRDPPNPDYAHLPPPYVLPPMAPLVASGTLTAAQASAINAWGLKSRALMAVVEQANQTMDNVSGAILAGPASPTARVWAYRLARFMDGLHDQIAVAMTEEFAARAAIVAAYPAVAVPAACITATQLGELAPDMFAIGAGVYSVAMFQDYALDHPCTSASTWPGVLLEGAASVAATAAAFAALTYSDTVCATTGYCSMGGTDTIGLWRPSTRTFYLRNTNTYGAPDLTIAGVGATGDVPLVGDWDGNGTTTWGLYRPSTQTFYLRNSNTYGAPDITVAAFGAAGDIPLVGDWDGNGTTTIGVYRPSTSTFYLRNSNTWGPPDITIAGLGAVGDTPIIGDWFGTGRSTIGLHRASTNTFYLWPSNAYGPPAAIIAAFGSAGDKPLVGDWDGDGVTTIGLYRPSTSTFYLRNSNAYGAPDITIANFGTTGDVPLAGDWNGQ